MNLYKELIKYGAILIGFFTAIFVIRKDAAEDAKDEAKIDNLEANNKAQKEAVKHAKEVADSDIDDKASRL